MAEWTTVPAPWPSHHSEIRRLAPSWRPGPTAANVRARFDGPGFRKELESCACKPLRLGLTCSSSPVFVLSSGSRQYVSLWIWFLKENRRLAKGRLRLKMALSSIMAVSHRYHEADIGTLRLLPSEIEHQYLTQVLRYMDAKSPNPVVKDPWVIDLHSKLEFNFDEGTHVDDAWVEWLAHRVRLFDEWTQRYIDEHAQKNEPITVLRLCPGLDSRDLRLSYSRSVRWIDMDCPQVIDLRRSLLPPPIGADYHQIKAEILTKEWLDRIPKDRPTLILAEHVFSCLPQAPAQDLIRRLADHFPSGHLYMLVTGALVPKVMNIMPITKGIKIRIQWGIDSPKQITSLNPRLRTLEAVTDRDLNNAGFIGGKKPPWFGSLTAITSIVPGGQTMQGYMRFAFDDYSQSIRSSKTTSTRSMRSSFSRSFRTANGSSSRSVLSHSTTSSSTIS
ncbi:S-adenosyl-L-methionine-dependent methyltransferase [Microdochium trichocladiopsis]|uniref:S-adenosyl-L-methionine-dependent methyltransferase n=1 Tax=Microdochium trichocladiopsis TaxID=1682393 RepID=A0A9P9BSE9_9PEZI|nr:S-adenosyl-L-methionine-dependent methyltransferase [Microdochium trichocladiopsis]KAH7037840.1 S-adenosyl-L-methionine-dependent methyltransferase [Microdochium trichocladiopsis]